ncbi:Flp family type IVb pilin [Pseudomonas sp. JS3066]|jgi:pilus assembly protein Flp/PilA|uniref:Flp family type IVb pilin n=1 Tax=unclassified Pseudomonas TaxID=196821 RepID=UPI000EA99DFC|nr:MULTISPECIES: Flp family type IVb pilin [unclassified Pseudomonas]AYF89882.1 Flp family type IVb pilin [Pseudomonas sp. DY-1]WVK92531.1 Flp family type IVb pilin [Pseudomonas sp. JS3066]
MSLKSLLKKLVKFSKEEEGASGLEYAIVAAMVAAVIVTFSDTISTWVNTTFTTITTNL